MYKIISFSVWGDDPKYLDGCLENIYAAKEFYDDWIIRFYCDSNMNQNFIDKLLTEKVEIVIEKINSSAWEGLFWRFKPAFEDDVDIFISRDVDSRLNIREKVAVDEWLASDKDVHAMRDHKEHNVPILGGMWGCRNKVLHDAYANFIEWNRCDYKGSDQDFLRTIVWKKYTQKIIVHDKFYQGTTFLEVVKNVKEYMEQRQNLADYIAKTAEEKEKYIKDAKLRAETINDEVLSKIFPVLPELKPIQKNETGEIIKEYFYDPIVFFGQHEIRPFPPHAPMKIGTHVGEII